tara:strand:- start:2643 stop:2834 length:192 start_codon:yes stop_codon:yes gene_type:complete
LKSLDILKAIRFNQNNGYAILLIINIKILTFEFSLIENIIKKHYGIGMVMILKKEVDFFYRQN